jgi:hypothetical protein
MLGLKARDVPGRIATRKPGSIWPSQQGTGVSKDIWMVGIGVGMVVGALTDRKKTSG